MIHVTVDEAAKKLTIEADLEVQPPTQSSRTIVVASTRGPLRTGLTVNGKPLTVRLNAFTSK